MRILSVVALLMLCTLTWANFPKDNKKKEEGGTLVVEPVYVEGVVYALPRTGLKIKVLAQKTEFVPGPYHQYAKQLLGLTVNQKVSSTWKLSNVAVSVFGEADPNEMYKALDSVASLVSLLPDGRLAGINTVPSCSEIKVMGSNVLLNACLPETFTDLSSDDFYDIILDSVSGSEVFEYKSMEVKAREAADYLIRLRKKRAFKILDAFDVVPEDGTGYAVFVKEAQRLEKAYVSLFAGKTTQVEQAFEFIYIPSEKNVKNDVLFRFSDEKGVLPKSDISGKPILIELSKEQNAFASAEKLKESEEPEAGSLGVFYRIPVVASLSVSDGLNQLYSGRVPVAQFGSIAPVPLKMLDGNYSIRFNDITGAIANVAQK